MEIRLRKDGHLLKKKFNYCIGRYWKGRSGGIGCYAIHNCFIFHGTEKEAQETLTFVQVREKDPKYRIFKLEEYKP